MPWSRFGLVLGLSLAASCAAAGSALPSVMVGRWLYGALSTVAYHDPSTDRWMDASGASEIVTYRSDGRYERTRVLSMRSFSCESKLFIYERGVVKLDGGRLTYQPSEGVNKGYTCSPSNSWSTSTINAETWALTFEKDGGKDVMVLSDGNGTARYSRDPH